jgi:hypothetical protein
MFKKLNILKITIFTIGSILSSLFALHANAQNFQSDISNLSKQAIESYKLNQPNISKKTPFKLSDLSTAQLSDLSIPNSVEISEINKLIQFRDSYFIEYGIIVKKYIKPIEAAQAMIQNHKDYLDRLKVVSVELKDGKINFGQYNSERQKITADLISNGNLIIQKYDLKGQLSSTETAQQVAKPGPYKQLQCKQYKPNGPHGQLIEIDCTSRYLVASATKTVAERLKNVGGVAGYFYKDCYKGFVDAMKGNLDLPMDAAIGSTYLFACNRGLYELSQIR